MPTVGTFDHYFDLADRLESLGTEFILTVRPKGFNGCITLSNVQSERNGKAMQRNIEEMLGDRFNPNPDQDDVV